MPANDTQVADHFKSTRPVLGICLKRYEMNAQGKPVRRNTPIDIPLQIALPHFIQDDKASTNSDGAPLFGNFNLVLQSMVCHRGNSLHSGHYVSVIRGGCKGRDEMPKSRPDSAEAPPDYAEDRWIKFDDLAPERVSYVDIEKIMVEEMPYLLFYQVQPLFPDDNTAEDTANRPPAYEDPTMEVVVMEATPSPVPVPVRASTTPLPMSGPVQTSYFDNYTMTPADGNKGRTSLSDDQERPRKSLTISDAERRGSLVFTDASTMSTYTSSMPATPNDENTPSTSSRLSRAASRFVKGKSRNGSVVGTERTSHSSSINAGFLTNRLNLMRSKEMLNGTSDASATHPEVHITETNDGNVLESKPPSLKSTTSDMDKCGVAGDVIAPLSTNPAGSLGVPGSGIDRSGSKRKKDKGRIVLGMIEDDEKTAFHEAKEKKHHHHHHGLSLGKGKVKDKEGKEGDERECNVM